jgi:hypothetical protein
MKRLIRKAKPITIYHGTNLLSLDKILQTGIAAGLIEDSPFYMTSKNQSFFGTNINTSIDYGQIKYTNDGSRMKDAIVVLEITFDTDYLEPDNDDAPFAKTWEESGNQVAVDGSIRAEQINYLYFYNNQRELIIDCTKDDYLSNTEEIKNKVYKSHIKNESEKMVEFIPVLDKILETVKQISMQIDRCKEILDLFDNISYKPNEEIESKLIIRHDLIFSLIKEANESISEYNNQGNQLPFIAIKKQKHTRQKKYEDKLQGLVIMWFDKKISTWESSKFHNESELINDFTSYLKEQQTKQQQNKIANKKRLTTMKESIK